MITSFMCTSFTLSSIHYFSPERRALQSSRQEWRWCCEHGRVGFTSYFSARTVMSYLS